MKTATQTAKMILAAVVFLTFLAYVPSLKNHFVNWDDDVHLRNNLTVHALDKEHLQEMFTTRVNNLYIPLTTLSFAVEYRFCGDAPFFYHLDNVLLHLFVVALVFILALELGLGVWGAGLGALLFGLHPMHGESVAWVTERKDVLCAAFYLWSLYGYIRYIKTQRRSFYAGAVLLGVLSMLAKPMAISLPLIFLLCDWFYGRKFSRGLFLEKAAPAVLLGLLAWISYAPHARIPGADFVQGTLIWIWTFVFYIRQFFVPLYLVPLYSLPHPVSFINGPYLLSIFIFAAILICLYRFRRQRWMIFAFSFYFLSIFFLLRFDELRDTNIVADRFMYLPSLGFCWGTGKGIEGIWQGLVRERRVRKVLFIVLVLLLSNFFFRTVWQGRVWQDSFRLWQYQLSINPQQPIALNNLASAYLDKKDFKEAIRKARQIWQMNNGSINKDVLDAEAQEAWHKIKALSNLYQKAMAADPGYIDAIYNLGNLYRELGRYDEAITLFEKAVKIDPSYKDAFFELGYLYGEKGNPIQAVEAYRKMIATDPQNEDLYVNVIKAYTLAIKKHPQDEGYKEARANALDIYTAMALQKKKAAAFFNLGYLYVEMEDYEPAIRAYRQALEIKPNYVSALYNLGNVYELTGQLRDALYFYGKVLALNPGYAPAYLNMGVVYGRLGEQEKAIQTYEKAIAVNPNGADAYFNLGFIYEAKGAISQAMKFYQKAVAVNPEHSEAYYNLGNSYARLGENEKAVVFYEKALKINPNHVDALVNLSIVAFRKGDYAKAIRTCDEARLLGYDPPKEYLREIEKYR